MSPPHELSLLTFLLLQNLLLEWACCSNVTLVFTEETGTLTILLRSFCAERITDSCLDFRRFFLNFGLSFVARSYRFVTSFGLQTNPFPFPVVDVSYRVAFSRSIPYSMLS